MKVEIFWRGIRKYLAKRKFGYKFYFKKKDGTQRNLN